MDDPRCQQFFLQPGQTQQKRYEAVRAVVVDQQPLLDVARRFGFAYGSLRNLISQFYDQIRAGQTPPFSPRRRADDPRRPLTTRPCRGLIPPPSPTAESSTPPPKKSYELLSRACFSFCLSSLNSALINSVSKQATPVPK
jgi:hypothetical protein